MHKSISLGLILGSALAMATVAVAAPQMSHSGDHHGRDGSGHGHGDHGGPMMGLKGLNLTDAQRSSVKQIIHDSFKQNASQFKDLRQQRQALMAMTPDQAGYQNAVDKLAAAEGTAAQAKTEARAKVRAEIYALLTPAQKTQLVSMKAQHEQRKQQWKEFQKEHPVNNTQQAQ